MNPSIKTMALFLFFLVTKAYSQSRFNHNETTIFKDGTVLFEKSAYFNPQDKKIKIYNLPFEIKEIIPVNYNRKSQNPERIIMGSIWFSCPDNKIRQVKLLTDSLQKSRKFTNTMQLLSFNMGKRIKIYTYNADSAMVGTIEKVFTNSRANYIDRRFVLISKGNFYHQVDIEQIRHFQFMSAPKLNREYSTRTKSALLTLQNNTRKQQVDVKYLQKGITWLPNYFIELSENKQGKITLGATILNDVEDIHNTTLNLAVGVPVFSYSYIPSPLASTSHTVDILGLIANPPRERNSQSGQNIMSQRYRHIPSTYGTNYTAQTEGKGSEDLFFYQHKNFSLPKGGRANVNLLEFDFKYEDIYSVNLQPNEQLYIKRRSNSKAWETRVWHSIKFKNNSLLPLTTGTVLFYKRKEEKLQVVSQNQLDYTPPKEITTVKMSIAPDIWVESKEKEIERKDIDYDEIVTAESNILLINYKSIPVELLVKRKITGNLIESDKQWQVNTALEKGYYGNKVNYVSWKIKMQPGQSKTINYKYKILID